MLTAKLNGTDVGNLNHSEKFAKSLDQAIYETMKDDLKCALEYILPSTNHKRPLGMVMDKMTPSKSTGQIHAIILPVPENSLSQPLLVPLMLDVPTVTEYDVSGLAKMAKKILNDAGAEDNQLEGLGWDGEYAKTGVKSKNFCFARVLQKLDSLFWTGFYRYHQDFEYQDFWKIFLNDLDFQHPFHSVWLLTHHQQTTSYFLLA